MIRDPINGRFQMSKISSIYHQYCPLLSASTKAAAQDKDLFIKEIFNVAKYS
jgi:hypothetical protein